jgi:hypothetical protein
MIDGQCGSPSGCGYIPVNVSLDYYGSKAYKTFEMFVNLKDKHSSYWGDDADNLTAFTAFVMGREAFPAWSKDEWFNGGYEGMPDIFTHAAAQWLWGWYHELVRKDEIGHVETSTDFRNVVLNWLGQAMQSLKGLFSMNSAELDKVLTNEKNKWHIGMLEVAENVLDPTTTHGNWVCYWGNASLPKWKAAQALLVDATIGEDKNQVRYRFGESDPSTAWYIMDQYQNDYWKNMP